MILTLILASLLIAATIFTVMLTRRCIAEKATTPGFIAICLGAVTDFLDTLGIGSFAPTMAWMKLQRLVPDRLIPATMITGHSLPVLVQSGVFLELLGAQVDPALLICCIVAMVVGGSPVMPRYASCRRWSPSPCSWLPAFIFPGTSNNPLFFGR